LNTIDFISGKINRYNQILKHIFFIFHYLLITLCATDCYVLFAGKFPDAFTRSMVILLSLSQLCVIAFCMSRASLPSTFSFQLSEVLFSMQARIGHHLAVRQKLRLIKTIHRITNKRHPMGYACGNVFILDARSFLDFVLQIMASTVLFLHIITQLETQ
jgi:hypothetical protein